MLGRSVEGGGGGSIGWIDAQNFNFLTKNKKKTLGTYFVEPNAIVSPNDLFFFFFVAKQLPVWETKNKTKKEKTLNIFQTCKVKWNME